VEVEGETVMVLPDKLPGCQLKVPVEPLALRVADAPVHIV